MSSLIFYTAFGYIVSLGLTNVLRYHYIQSLEDILYKIVPRNEKTEGFIHWFSFSSPITTRNILHLKSIYAWIHYISYAGAVICAISFSLIITFVQYENVKNYEAYKEYSKWALIITCIIMGVSILGFFFICLKSRRMYENALIKSKENRKNRLEKEQKQTERNCNMKKFWFKLILYFIYPKKKDFQKTFLFIIGAIFGIMLQNNTLNIQVSKENIFNIGISWIVIEFLVYASRYQLNDVRGLGVDLEYGRNDRLPIGPKGEEYSSKITSIVLVMKLFIAFFIISKLEIEIQTILLRCSFAIIIIAILYEIARTKKWDRLVFVLVSFGYPLRFLSGMWVVWPKLWVSEISLINKTVLIWPFIVLLLLSITCYGEYSAVFSWVHEVVEKKKKSMEIDGKSYFEFLYKYIKQRIGNYKIDSILKEKGKWNHFWNLVYLGSMICLSIIISCSFVDVEYLVMEGITCIFAFLFCKKFCNNLICAGIDIVIFFGIKGYLYWLQGYHIWWLLIGIFQLIYTSSYLFLRYLFTPDWKFSEIIHRIYVCIIGKETYEYIEKRKIQKKV